MYRPPTPASASPFSNFVTFPVGASGNSSVTGGGADDTGPFQAAINAITAAGGGTLYIPPRTFRITGPLTNLPSYIRIEGGGKACRILNDTTTSDVFQIGSQQRVEFANFEIRTNDNKTATAGAALNFSGTTFLPKVQNMSLQGNFDAVKVIGTNGSQTINGLLLDNIDITNCRGTGMHFSNAISTRLRTIVNSGAAGNTGNGIFIDSGVQDIAAFQVDNLNFGTSMLVNTATSLQGDFERCVFDGASTVGLNFAQAYQGTFTKCYFGSTLTGASGATIGAGGCTLVTFDNCDFLNTARFGLVVNVGAVDTLVRNCRFYNNSFETANTYDALSIASNTNNFTVQGSVFTNTSIPGYTGTQRYGIVVNTGTSANYTLSTNYVLGNGTGGIADGGTGANALVVNNIGYNPTAPNGFSPGPSPYTYTAGHAPETLFIIGGTVSAIVTSTVGVFSATSASGPTIPLPANGTVTITYSGAPTLLSVPQ